MTISRIHTSILAILIITSVILNDGISVRGLPDKLQVITAPNAARIEELAQLGNGAIDQLLWAPNNQYIVAFGPSGAWLFDSNNIAEPEAHVQDHSPSIEYAAFSPDNRLIATGSDDAVIITDIATGEELYSLDNARGFVAFSPDGNWIITDSTNSSASPIVWSASSGQQVATLERNDLASLTAVAFSPDGSQLAAVYQSLRWGYMNAIKIWDVQMWGEQLRIPSPGYHISSISFSDSNTQLNAYADGELLMWSLQDGGLIETGVECPQMDLAQTMNSLGINPDDVLVQALSSDLAHIAFIDPDGFLEIGALDTHDIHTSSFAFSSQFIREIAFSPDNRLLAAVEMQYDGTVDVRLWDLTQESASSTSIAIADSPGISSSHLVFLSNDRLMIYGNRNGRVQIWDITAEAFTADFYLNLDERSVLAVKPDLSAITAVNWQSNSPLLHMQTWDITSGEKLSDYSNPGSYEQSPILWNAVYSPDSTLIATAGRAAHLWNAQTGEEVAVLYDYTSLEGQWEINNVTFSPDARFLAADTAEWNSLIYVWDVQQAIETHPATIQDRLADTGSLVAELSHGSAAFVFSPNGELLISGAHGSFWGGDSTIQIWNTSDWETLTILRGHIDGVTSLAMTSDNMLLASAGFDGTIRLWGVEE